MGHQVWLVLRMDIDLIDRWANEQIDGETDKGDKNVVLFMCFLVVLFTLVLESVRLSQRLLLIRLLKNYRGPE